MIIKTRSRFNELIFSFSSKRSFNKLHNKPISLETTVDGIFIDIGIPEDLEEAKKYFHEK